MARKTAVVASVVIAVAAISVMAFNVSCVVAGTIAGPAALKAITGASVFLGAALSGLNGGVANASKGNSYLNGYVGGATGGAIQSKASVNAMGTIVGGSVGVAIGTAVTDVLNNIDPDSSNSTAQEIINNALTSGGKAALTSTVTAFMNNAVGGFSRKNFVFEGALSTGADGLMPQLTPGFGEEIKAFFGAHSMMHWCICYEILS